MVKLDQPLYSSGDSTEHVGKPLAKCTRLNWEQFLIQVILGVILVFYCLARAIQHNNKDRDTSVEEIKESWKESKGVLDPNKVPEQIDR